MFEIITSLALKFPLIMQGVVAISKISSQQTSTMKMVGIRWVLPYCFDQVPDLEIIFAIVSEMCAQETKLVSKRTALFHNVLSAISIVLPKTYIFKRNYF